MKHIALGGMSFCGSTVLSYVLGSLPGFCNIGESHWLTDRTKTGERIFCARCGPTCKVLHEGVHGLGRLACGVDRLFEIKVQLEES